MVDSPDGGEGIERPLDEGLDNSAADTIEEEGLSFIVKLWVGERAEQAGGTSWRGHITHVPSGDRGYFRELDAISAFISPYLEAMGVRRGLWRGLRRIFGRH